MFSLIITIVSIALVVALVAATMYYGGDTLTQGRTQADAAAFVAGAQQITGAASMFTALEGAAPAVLGDLVTQNYLSSLPSAEFAAGETWNLDPVNRTLTAVVASADVCTALEERGGDLYGCVSAGDPAVNTFTFNY